MKITYNIDDSIKDLFLEHLALAEEAVVRDLAHASWEKTTHAADVTTATNVFNASVAKTVI